MAGATTRAISTALRSNVIVLPTERSIRHYILVGQPGFRDVLTPRRVYLVPAVRVEPLTPSLRQSFLWT